MALGHRRNHSYSNSISDVNITPPLYERQARTIVVSLEPVQLTKPTPKPISVAPAMSVKPNSSNWCMCGTSAD